MRKRLLFCSWLLLCTCGFTVPSFAQSESDYRMHPMNTD
jgi:hypothetical protein